MDWDDRTQQSLETLIFIHGEPRSEYERERLWVEARVRSASTRDELLEAHRVLGDWMNAHPDDIGMLALGELIFMTLLALEKGDGNVQQSPVV